MEIPRAQRVLLGLLLGLPALPSIASPVPAGFARVVVLGVEEVEIEKDVEVRSGDLVAQEAGGELKLKSGASTPAGFRIAADEVQIERGARVGGDVAYNELDNEGTIDGALLTPLALPVFASLPPFEAATPGSEDIEVDDGDTLTLPPGDYGALEVKKEGVVVFSGGVYNFEKVKVDKDAVLAFEAFSRVRVAEKLEAKQACRIGPAEGTSIAASDLSFFVGEEIEFDKECIVSGTFYSLDGEIKLKKDIVATGAFVAHEVKIDKNVALNLDSAFNEPPQAVDDALTVAEGGVATVLDSGALSVLANDSDPNAGDTLAVTTTPVSGPDHGVVLLAADGTFDYTHDGSETLADAFVYQVCDDGFPIACATATVSVTVLPVNDPPVAADDAAATDEDTPVVIDVLANDSDVDGTLDPASVAVTSAPSMGAVAVDPATGAITYTPEDPGTDTFVYQVCDDGVPVLCASAEVTVSIEAVNDPPNVRPDQATAAPGSGPIFVRVLDNDDDPDGLMDPATVTITSPVSNGTASVDPFSGIVTFVPDAGFIGVVSFTYEACDNGVPPPVLCGSAGIRIEIISTSGNQPPVAEDGEAQVDPGQAVVITLRGSDPDGDPLGFSIAGSPSQGVLSNLRPASATSATVTYTAREGASGSDLFDFVVDDGNGGTDRGTVRIGLDRSNRRPVARDDRAIVAVGDSVSRLISGDPSVLSNDFDADGDPLVATTTPITPPLHGALTLSADGRFTYTHDGGAENRDDFVYEVCDDGVPALCDTANVRIDIRQTLFSVQVVKVGDGAGSVTSEPAGIDCGGVCSARYPSATRVRLDARAAAGSTFAGWSGDADCADAELDGLADVTCLATFVATQGASARLTIVKQGAGQGTVSSNPAGIVCGARCAVDFPLGTTVGLLVRPDDAASVFAGWSGDADCVDGLVTLNVDTTCIATFDLR